MTAWNAPRIGDRPVVVLGGGVLGRRVACVWAAGGHRVNIRDPSPEQRNAAIHYIDNNVAKYSETIGSSPGKYTAFADLEPAVKDAFLVIEAVPEKLSLKIDTFGELDSMVPADCCLCSNSSSYKSSLMIDKVDQSRRNRVLNMHYMMPPDNVVVELMTCGETDPAIFDFLVEQLKKIGMHPVVARQESTGFVFNRIWAAIKREVLMVLADGVSTPEEIDSLWLEMFKNSVAGPCGMMDAVGLDTVEFIENNYIKERQLGTKTVDFLHKNYIEKGLLGAKSGKGGFYPAGATTKSKDEESSHHDNLHAPTLYFLDIGLATTDLSNVMHAGKILCGGFDGRPMRTLVDKQSLPDGLDISLSAGRLFWTNMGIPNQNDGYISSCNLDGSDVQIMVPIGKIHTPKQLVIDDANKKIYVSDREGLRVFRCNMDGSSLETLVQRGDWRNTTDAENQTNWCVGITVDPKHKVFYWTQKGPSKGSKGRIFRANMDLPVGETANNRSDIETLFSNLPECIDLDFDPKTQSLWWSDRGELPLGNSINKAYVGPERESYLSSEDVGQFEKKLGYKIVASRMHEAIGIKLDVINRHFYATDMGGAVYRYDLDGGDRRKVYEDMGAFTGIGIAHV